MRFGDLEVTTSTGPTGSPQLRLALPVSETVCPDDAPGENEVSQRLDRRDVEDLRDFLGEWLR